MKIRRLQIRSFRGFDQLDIVPRGHVFLVGQPGAGRSDVSEALWRVLSPDSTRSVLVDDLDFHRRDRGARVEIEVVLGELGTELQQLFLDRIEYWRADRSELIEELGPEHEIPPDELEPVVRLCYRAEWQPEEQQANQWVDFPKFSDVDGGVIARVPRALRERLPFTRVRTSSQLLSLGSRGDLRRLVDAEGAGDFAPALESLLNGVDSLAEGLHDSSDLSSVLGRVLEPLRVPLNLADRSASDVIRFAPDGGSLAGVLRGLAPTVKLREELGFIPLERHGSTLAGVFELARAVAQTKNASAVVAVDDFAETVDPLAAQHLAATLRQEASQLWLSTRAGVLGEVFRPDELVRLTVSHEGQRQAFVGPVPASKAERVAARNLHLQLLPAASARAVLVVEGPHDRAAIAAAALHLSENEAQPLLAARRIAVVDAGAADSHGGITAVPRLCNLARQLGFFVISLIDWDRKAEEAAERLSKAQASADVVIRWPEGVAIERALVSEMDDSDLRSALESLSDAAGIPLGFTPSSESGTRLQQLAVKFIKSGGGLHSLFLHSLPDGVFPNLVRRAIEEIRSSVSSSGLVQL